MPEPRFVRLGELLGAIGQICDRQARFRAKNQEPGVRVFQRLLDQEEHRLNDANVVPIGLNGRINANRF